MVFFKLEVVLSFFLCQQIHEKSIPRFGILRMEPAEEFGVIRERSLYPLLRGIIRPASFSALCFYSLGLIIVEASGSYRRELH